MPNGSPGLLTVQIVPEIGEYIVCPFFDKACPRCSALLNLRNLTRVFAHCADSYTACPIYQALAEERISDGHQDSLTGVAAGSAAAF